MRRVRLLAGAAICAYARTNRETAFTELSRTHHVILFTVMPPRENGIASVHLGGIWLARRLTR